jgi:hypothetical protein
LEPFLNISKMPKKAVFAEVRCQAPISNMQKKIRLGKFTFIQKQENPFFCETNTSKNSRKNVPACVARLRQSILEDAHMNGGGCGIYSPSLQVVGKFSQSTPKK